VTKKQNIKILSLAFIFILTPFSQKADGSFTGVLEGEGVRVLFEKPLQQTAAETVRLYPSIKEDLEVLFGWKIAFAPTVMLFHDHNRFRMTVDSDLVVAYAIPGKNLILIDYSTMQTDPFKMEAVFKHELCHLLLHRYMPNERLPKWLDEGIAQWVSGGLADVLMNLNKSELNRAMLSHHYIPIRTLTERFPKDGPLLMLAYEESRSLVEYIIDVYEVKGLLHILDRLQNGDGIDSAVQQSLSISFEELEQTWHEGLKSRMAWFLLVSNNLYEILFFVASLALIIGFVRILLKKRAYSSDKEDNGSSPSSSR
jgi:hypothetical protein